MVKEVLGVVEGCCYFGGRQSGQPSEADEFWLISQNREMAPRSVGCVSRITCLTVIGLSGALALILLIAGIMASSTH